MRAIKLLSLLLTLSLISGCAVFKDATDETKDWSASKFYSEGKSALNDGDYTKAINYFEMLEARYPFGRYAQQAQLETAYAYYKSDDPASAIAAADRFIKMHPRHPNVDYAYYLKGLANYDRNSSFVDRYLPTDRSQRDPGAARDSFNDFNELVRQFPDSRYAEDARQRMLYLRNNLAQYEVHVADYYMRRGAHLAAANRAKYVVEHYQNTPAVPQALAVMNQAYRALGRNDLAEDAVRVLKMNFPDHQPDEWIRSH
jgi:outer membrane protein assembly factor BamD